MKKNFINLFTYLLFGSILTMLVLVSVFVVDNSHITRLTFEGNQPSTSEKHSELISDYKVACKKAVETASSTNVVEEYIRCASAGAEEGMYYYCMIQDGSCYKFRVDAADAIYENIMYGTSIRETEVPQLKLTESYWRCARLVES